MDLKTLHAHGVSVPTKIQEPVLSDMRASSAMDPCGGNMEVGLRFMRGVHLSAAAQVSMPEGTATGSSVEGSAWGSVVSSVGGGMRVRRSSMRGNSMDSSAGGSMVSSMGGSMRVRMVGSMGSSMEHMGCSWSSTGAHLAAQDSYLSVWGGSLSGEAALYDAGLRLGGPHLRSSLLTPQLMGESLASELAVARRRSSCCSVQVSVPIPERDLLHTREPEEPRPSVLQHAHGAPPLHLQQHSDVCNRGLEGHPSSVSFECVHIGSLGLGLLNIYSVPDLNSSTSCAGSQPVRNSAPGLPLSLSLPHFASQDQGGNGNINTPDHPLSTPVFGSCMGRSMSDCLDIIGLLDSPSVSPRTRRDLTHETLLAPWEQQPWDLEEREGAGNDAQTLTVDMCCHGPAVPSALGRNDHQRPMVAPAHPHHNPHHGHHLHGSASCPVGVFHHLPDHPLHLGPTESTMSAGSFAICVSSPVLGGCAREAAAAPGSPIWAEDFVWPTALDSDSQDLQHWTTMIREDWVDWPSNPTTTQGDAGDVLQSTPPSTAQPPGPTRSSGATLDTAELGAMHNTGHCVGQVDQAHRTLKRWGWRQLHPQQCDVDLLLQNGLQLATAQLESGMDLAPLQCAQDTGPMDDHHTPSVGPIPSLSGGQLFTGHAHADATESTGLALQTDHPPKATTHRHSLSTTPEVAGAEQQAPELLRLGFSSEPDGDAAMPHLHAQPAADTSGAQSFRLALSSPADDRGQRMKGTAAGTSLADSGAVPNTKRVRNNKEGPRKRASCASAVVPKRLPPPTQRPPMPGGILGGIVKEARTLQQQGATPAGTGVQKR